MIVEIRPSDAIKIVEPANAAGIPHAFVQTTATTPDELALHWQHDRDASDMKIVLSQDGTWHATLVIDDIAAS